MVARGGRSKGCTNCRRRRIKCDETRPTCIRCQKRGLTCDGPKASTFINEALPSSFRVAGKTVRTVATDLPAQLSLCAFQDDICLAFAHKTLLRGGPIDIACKMAFSNQGVASADGDPATLLLRDSLTSLAIAHFGNKHDAVDVQQKSYRMYGEVLRQLNRHLDLPDLRVADSTILTSLICMLRELFFPTGPNHFLKHLQGIETMLRLRGAPTAPIPPETLVILHGLRTLSIVSGLFVARPSLFAEEAWKQIPHVQTDEEGQIRHKILRVLADCTNFIAARDVLIRSNNSNARQSLLREIADAQSKLESIRSNWTPVGRRRPFAGLKQDKGRSMVTYMVYNATYICLLDIRQPLEPSLEYDFLRSFAVQEIIAGLERLSQKPGGTDFSIIRIVVIQVALHAIGGSKTHHGQRLVRFLQGAGGAGAEVNIKEANKLEKMGIGQIFC